MSYCDCQPHHRQIDDTGKPFYLLEIRCLPLLFECKFRKALRDRSLFIAGGGGRILGGIT